MIDDDDVDFSASNDEIDDADVDFNDDEVAIDVGVVVDVDVDVIRDDFVCGPKELFSEKTTNKRTNN